MAADGRTAGRSMEVVVVVMVKVVVGGWVIMTERVVVVNSALSHPFQTCFKPP